MLIETTDGFEQVSLKKQTCSCSDFSRARTCLHLQSASKWLGKHWDRYICLSSFQKEIRRCDTEKVFAWANVLRHHQSEQSIIKHIERLIFEESRAYLLWIKLRKGELSLNQALEWVSTAAKKQELCYLNRPSHFDLWHAGFTRSLSRPPPLPLELGQLIRAAQDPTDIYTLFFDLRRDPKLQPHYWEHLKDIAIATKNERLAVFLKHQPSTSYERMVAGELLLNLYDGESKERHVSNQTGKIFIPMVQIYSHDLHTAKGKSVWIENFGRAWTTKCFEFGDLCTNWSGSLFGVLFRERCFAQKSSMKKLDGNDWHWSEVEIGDADYEKAWGLENYYYARVTSKIKNRHPNLKGLFL